MLEIQSSSWYPTLAGSQIATAVNIARGVAARLRERNQIEALSWGSTANSLSKIDTMATPWGCSGLCRASDYVRIPRCLFF